MENEQLLVFNLDKEEFGLNIKHIDQIIQYSQTVKVPDTPDFIEGLLSLRGQIYTVFNLRRRFGFPTCEFDEMTKIIIVKVNSISFGLIVDGVKEILRYEEANIENTSKTRSNINNKFIIGSIRFDERIIEILAVNEVVSFIEDELKANA